MPDILIVCRDPHACEIFELMLRHAGFDVSVVPDPAIAVDAVLADRPRLVITNFPTVIAANTVGELTATEALRDDAGTAGIPILSVTSHVMPFELERAESAGVTRSLRMPVTFDVLISAVRDLIGPPPERSA